MAAWLIGEASAAKEKIIEDRVNTLGRLRKNNSELGVKVRSMEIELAGERKKLKKVREAHRAEVEELRNGHASVKKHAKDLESRIQIERVSWGVEKLALQAQVEALKQQLPEAVTIPPPAPTAITELAPITDQVITAYKASDDFHDDMEEHIEHGAYLIQNAMIVDRHIDRSQVVKYSFIECIKRVGRGELALKNE